MLNLAFYYRLQILLITDYREVAEGFALGDVFSIRYGFINTEFIQKDFEAKCLEATAYKDNLKLTNNSS
jgi:hypothetical protein